MNAIHHNILLRGFSILCLLSLWAGKASAQPASVQPTSEQHEGDIVLYDYVVQEGDSCAGIATRKFGSRKAYSTIHKHNKLGPLPHHLRPGSVLRLPRIERTPDAKLESRVGKVQYRKVSESLWGAASKGMDIFRAWRVWSHKRSTAVLVFRDDSVLSLRNDTIVVIYGPTAREGKKQILRAELETGSLRSRLAALEGKLLVETDASSVELGTGGAVISASPTKKRSSISNHEGGSIAVRKRRGKRSRSVKIAPGKGTWVEDGKAPAPPRDLPPTPELIAAPRLQVALASAGAVLRGSWKPVLLAERYRVEVATDPNVRIVVAAFEVAKNITSFEARGLAPGQYYISVASIDDKGLESAPSPRQPRQIALLSHTPLDGATRIAQGSQLVAPSSLRCTAGDEAPRASLPLLKSGPVAIRCTDADGIVSAPLDLHVAGWDVAVPGHIGRSATIPRSKNSEILLVPSPALPDGAKVHLEGDASVFADVASAGPDGIRIRISPGSDAPASTELRILRSTPAGDIQLTSLALTIPRPQLARSTRRVAIGIAAGLYHASLETDAPSKKQASFVGVRGSVQLRGRLELEAETRLARRASEKATFFAQNQLLLAWREPVFAKTHIRARLGPTLWHNQEPGVASVTSIGIAFGIGLEHAIGPGELRFDLGGYAFGDASGRLSGGISYQWELDLLR